MENYLTIGMLTLFGLILGILIRSALKIVEKLGNGVSTKPQNPEELYGIMLEAVNRANKLSEDRARKRAPKDEDEEPINTDIKNTEDKITALWEQYKELGGA